jgi:hypothetical protein
MPHPVNLPPVTQQHLLHAYAIIRPIGVSFEAAMQRPECATLRRVIECKAAQLRTEAWKATQIRPAVPVRRVRLDADGQPAGWCTQMTRGPYEPILQPELPNIYPTHSNP